MLISYIALVVGTLAVLCSCVVAGRLAGFSVTALWSAGTAYFVMDPVYSFRVSSLRDLAALALYGAVGIVLANTRPLRTAVQSEPEVPEIEPPAVDRIDLKTVLTDLQSSSELGGRLKQRQIEFEASLPRSFRCSYVDAVRILSYVFAAVLTEPQLRRISIHASRQPGIELLFVCAHRVWPPPLQKMITIGKGAADSSQAGFSGLPSYLAATWIDNGYGRIYQIRSSTPGTPGELRKPDSRIGRSPRILRAAE